MSLILRKRKFSPRQLFAAGEVGAWFEPGSLDTLYQTSTGTTAVTAGEQPVGLVLDKSKGFALGPELVTNGDFSNGATGWSVDPGWTVSGGAATTNTSNTSSLQQSVSTVLGRSFLLEFTASSGVSANLTFLIINQTFNDTYLNGCAAGVNRVLVRPTNGTGIRFRSQMSGLSIDNISVRELTGSHALQSSSTLRPTYKVGPNRLYFDADPDALTITFPSAPGNSTLAYGVSGGEPVITYPVNISGTTYTIDPSVIGTFGPELVTNGGFDSDTVWSRGSGWSIGDGVATKTAGSSSYLSQTSNIPSGKTYKFEFTVSNRTAGNIGARLENAAATLRSSNGAFVEYITSNSTNPRIILSADSNFNGSVDNISVRELTGAAAQNTGLVIVNRALTAAETVKLTQYLKARS